MNIPDLTGFLFEDAEAYLKENNVNYTVSETSSPRNDVEGNEMRVVRVIVDDEKKTVNLTLCRY